MNDQSKKRVNIYIAVDTDERLRQYAYENHLTISGAITKLVWDAKVKNEQLRGQMSLDLGQSGKGKKAGNVSRKNVEVPPAGGDRV